MTPASFFGAGGVIASLVYVGFAVEVGLFVVLAIRIVRERKILRRIGDTAHDRDAFASLVFSLPEPYRSVGIDLAEGSQSDLPLDGLLTKVIVTATNQSFARTSAAAVLIKAAVPMVLLLPVSVGLLWVGGLVFSTHQQALSKPALYLHGLEAFEASSSVLHAAFGGSAFLMVNLAVLWALKWWFRRPEVREARLVRSLLEAAAQLRPGERAPVSGHMAELTAPERGLRLPLTATCILLMCISLGWSLLCQTAPVKAANNREAVFEVWPELNRRPIGPKPDVQLPIAFSGAPLVSPVPASLEVGTEQASLKGILISKMIGENLPSGWQTRVHGLHKTLADYENLGHDKELMVLAHAYLGLSVVVELLEFMQTRYDIQKFYLAVERRAGLSRNGTRLSMQSLLPLRLGPLVDGAVDGRVKLYPRSVRFSSGLKVLSLANDNWPFLLRQMAREQLTSQGRPLRVAIQTEGLVSYERFIQVLSALDSVCTGRVDCGLPGLGIEYILDP